MRKFDDIPKTVIDVKRDKPKVPRKNSISLSQKGVFTFGAKLRNDFFADLKEPHAIVRAEDGELYIKVQEGKPSDDTSSPINKEKGIVSAKIPLNNLREQLPKIQPLFDKSDAVTIKFVEGESVNGLGVDSEDNVVMIDTNNIQIPS